MLYSRLFVSAMYVFLHILQCSMLHAFKDIIR